MKLILKLFLFFSVTIGVAQNQFTYWFSIPNTSKVPLVEQKQNEVLLDFNDKTLNSLFSKYTIYSFKASFPTSKTPYLQTMYEMEIDNVKLINEILGKHSSIFLNIEDKPELQLLYIPNDFGTNGGVLFEQEELNYIRAPETWDLLTIGNPNIELGISESVNISHEDLIGQSDVLSGSSSTYNGHGTSVSLFAGARSNNSTGIASIGHDCFIRSKSGGTNAVIQLAQSGVKVINMSWGSCNLTQHSINIRQMAMDEAYENGAVLIAAAGNGAFSCSSLGAGAYHYPAANNHVIAVTVVGHLYELNDPDPTHNNQKDRFEAVGNTYPSTTHNDMVDIAAPGRYVLTQTQGQPTGTYSYGGGTSYAAPIVTGTVGLMLDMNYCIDQEEIETILKLTSRKIDHLSVNQAFYGEIGSGVLDSYEAVNMANEMAKSFGTVEVKDRVLYRWNYKLETAPYEIKMTNNDVTGNAILNFKARNNIEILSGDYYPQSGGYIELQIDETLALDCPPPPPPASRKSNLDTNDKLNKKKIEYKIVPTLVESFIEIIANDLSIKNVSNVKVFNLFGIEVISKNKFDNDEIRLNMETLNEGIYLVKLYNLKGETIHTQKIIKK